MSSTNSINGWNSPCNPGNVVVPKSSCSTPLTVRSHQSPNSSKSIAIPSLPISASSRHGLSALSRPRKLGAPPRLSKKQIAAIWRLADQAPTTLGLPLGRGAWPSCAVPHPPTHRPHDQPRAPAPGAEKRGSTLRRVRRKLFSTDPNRHLILHRLRTWWHNRPRGAILAFFDVQPITVKAYGGRRYTRAKRLVLRRNQKTRGRFYLFLLYEVNQGRVHWAFYPGKGAKYVCRFLRLVRRWYPRQVVRIGLDRDPAHPIKARMTRRTMRQLRLHWTSMPKGSPDDNPAETIFSDIQQNILDNSDDPDERATKGRITTICEREIADRTGSFTFATWRILTKVR